MAIIGVKVARVTNLTSWPLGREAAEIAEVLSIEPYTLLLIIYQYAMYTYRGCDVLIFLGSPVHTALILKRMVISGNSSCKIFQVEDFE